MNEDLDYRVKKRKRCEEYGRADETRVRCTREKDHEGIHVTQISKDLIISWDRYSKKQLEEVVGLD